MSWHYSQALAAEYSLENSSAGALSVQSKSRNTRGTCYLRGKKTARSTPSQCGTMSPPSTACRGVEWWISSLAASRAKTSAQPERAQDSTASEAASGLKCLGSLARFDLDSRSWKTHQFSLLGGLESFSETWPRWGMMRGGECWELSTPARLTSETESGSLPTPRATDGDKGSRTAQGAAREWARGRNKDLGMVVAMWPTPKASAAGPDLAKLDRSATGISLQTAVALWPTPTVCGNYNRKGASKNSGDGLATVVRRYPTPGANEDSYRLNGNSQQSNSLGAIARREALAESPESGGQLNPTWVEWLMGWPLGWTDSAQSATDKFRQWCASHGIS